LKSDFWDSFGENYRDLYRFAVRMLDDPESAEDAVQESFLRLVQENNERLQGESARRWLFVVVRNLCISQLRKKARQEFAVQLEDLQSAAMTPSEAVQANERSACVKTAVQELPIPLREIVILREYENMRYADIAAILGCPVGTVRSRLAAARDRLRKRLEPLMEANT